MPGENYEAVQPIHKDGSNVLENPYESPTTGPHSTDPPSQSPNWVWGVLSITVSAFALCFPILVIFDFARYPQGMEMRPMMHASAAVVSAAMGLFLATPLALVSLFVGRHTKRTRAIAWVAVVLSVAAIVTHMLLFHCIVVIRGYVLLE